MMKETKIGNSE